MRISDQGMLTRLIGIRDDFQRKISDLGIDMATGTRNQSLSAYGMKIPILLSLSQQISALNNYQTSISLVSNTTKDYDLSLQSMRDLMHNAKTFLSDTGINLPTTPTKDDIQKFQKNMRTEGETILEQLNTYLNTQGINGYQFAGKRTTVTPVCNMNKLPTWTTRDIIYSSNPSSKQTPQIPFVPITSGPKLPAWTFTDENNKVTHASYLNAWNSTQQSDAESWYKQNTYIANGVNLQYGITATNQAFQYMVHAALLIKTLGNMNPDDPYYRNQPTSKNKHTFITDVKAIQSQAMHEITLAISHVTPIIQSNILIADTTKSISSSQDSKTHILSMAFSQIVNLNEDLDVFAARYSFFKQGITLSQKFMSDMLDLFEEKIDI